MKVGLSNQCTLTNKVKTRLFKEKWKSFETFTTAQHLSLGLADLLKTPLLFLKFNDCDLPPRWIIMFNFSTGILHSWISPQQHSELFPYLRSLVGHSSLFLQWHQSPALFLWKPGWDRSMTKSRDLLFTFLLCCQNLFLLCGGESKQFHERINSLHFICRPTSCSFCCSESFFFLKRPHRKDSGGLEMP